MLVSGNCGTGCVGVTGTDAVPSVANVLFNSVYNCKEEEKTLCKCSNYVWGAAKHTKGRSCFERKNKGTAAVIFFLVRSSNCCALVFQHSFAL